MATSKAVKALLAAVGMGDGYDQGCAEIIRRSIRKDTGRKAAPGKIWPGTPLTIFPLVFSPTVRAMIQRGEVELCYVDNPRRPSGRTAYLRFPTEA
jgi:hypothetical protein